MDNMQFTMRLQHGMVAALEAEEDRERQTLLCTHQRAHMSSGGCIVCINGIKTHLHHEGVTETIVIGMQIPSQPEIVGINRRRKTAELLHPPFMLRPNLVDPFSDQTACRLRSHYPNPNPKLPAINQ
jgi:hypothetical protein